MNFPNNEKRKRSTGWRVTSFLFTIVAYVIVFFPLYDMTGGGVGGALAIIPVALAGWVWGLRGGLVVGLILSFMTAFLIDEARQGGGSTIFRSLVGPGTWALLLMGAIVGYLRDLWQKLKIELAERKRAQLAEREQRLYAEAMSDVAAVLSSSLVISEVMERILESVDRVVPQVAASIMLLGERKDVVRVISSKGYAQFGADIQGLSFQMSSGSSFYKMIATRRPIIINDTHSDSDWIANSSTAWIQSYLGVPLQINDEIVGFLSVDSPKQGYFTTDHAQRLQSFADQASIAIQNARLYERTDEKLRETIHALKLQTDALINALEVKNYFQQRMSHELRTPLNAIIGFSEMLKLESFGPLTDKQSRYVGNILESGERLLALVNNVLDLTEIEAGGVTPDPKSTLVADLHINSIQTFASRAEEKNIEVRKELTDSSLTVFADPDHLLRVINILVDNAIKFTPMQGRVTLSANEKKPAEIEITVSDTGVGIKKADSSKVFAHFQQSEGNALTRSHEGAGLSLALAKALVELNNGRIWFESEGVPGRGTTFFVAVPDIKE
jgi:signal transduction histidine kinase